MPGLWDQYKPDDLGIKAPQPQEEPASKPPGVWSKYGPKSVNNGLLVEPEYYPAYSEYMRNQTPESASKLVSALAPVIDESLRSYGGSEAQSVTARARAKRLALEAIKRYDPARAKLRTHLLSHLRGLRRTVERSTSGIYVPEQWRIDARHVQAHEVDARDELGREPSDAEIADRSGIPLERVRRARQVPGMLAGSQYDGQITHSGMGQQAYDKWVESIYHDLTPVDQVILERSFGLHGKEILPAVNISKMLNLSPGAVSQRKAKIQQMLDEYDNFMGVR